MITLVTLDQIKKALVIDFADDDDALDLMNLAASAAVLDYLKLDAEDLIPLTGGGVSEIDDRARQGTILLVGFLYRNRDRNDDKDFSRTGLPAPVVSILHPLRYPSFA